MSSPRTRAERGELVRPLSAARVLRPLPGRRAPSQPALSRLGQEGLTVVGGRSHVASESIAQLLAARHKLANTAWLRLEPLDVAPHCLLESILCAAAHAGHDSPTPLPDPDIFVRSPRDVGHRLAECIGNAAIVVIEDEDPHRSSVRVIEALVAFCDHAGSGTAAVYLSHGPLRRPAVAMGDVVIDGNNRKPSEARDLLSATDPDLPVFTLARLMSLAGHHDPLLIDVLDATSVRDRDLISHLTAVVPGHRSLEDRINARLLPQLCAAELQALSIGYRTGYWHPSLGDRDLPPGMTLRPWMLPLEAGWWWLRPLWRRSLARFLDASHRSSRRFYADYQTAVHRPPDFLENGARSVMRDVPSLGNGQPLRHVEPEAHATHPGSDDLPSEEMPPATVVVQMFGALEVEVDGQRVPRWHGRLGRSIVSYLMLQPERCASKDQLIEMFWPDVEPASAQNRLRVAVSSLRRSLRTVTDHQLIEFHDGNYRISSNCEIRLDVDDFESNAKRARIAKASGNTVEALAGLKDAIECYRADLLTEAPYEEWTFLPREALRVSYLECLSEAAALQMSRQDHGEVLRLAWAILAVDPAREDAHRLIMRCHAAEGRPHQSLRQFELCRRELATNLGVEPAPATVRLLESIRDDYPP